MMPGSLGYMQATWPLAVLEISGGHLVLRLRPWVLAKITGTEPLTVKPNSGAVIMPVRSNWIEIRVPMWPSYYFWATDRDEIMANLTSAGFDVSAEEGRMP
jgi:phage terminase large subunit-like protein